MWCALKGQKVLETLGNYKSPNGHDDLTVNSVVKAWKTQITAPGVHPEQGGDNESAIYLNLAKDNLLRWLEGNTGPGPHDDGDPRRPSGVPRKPKPRGGSTAV